MIKLIKNIPSEPIASVIGFSLKYDKGGFLDSYMDLCQTLHDRGIKNLIKYHKSKLGKQDYCFDGECRTWVWDRTDWRVYVGNVRGIVFEVRTKDERKALAYFEEYKKAII